MQTEKKKKKTKTLQVKIVKAKKIKAKSIYEEGVVESLGGEGSTGGLSWGSGAGAVEEASLEGEVGGVPWAEEDPLYESLSPSDSSSSVTFTSLASLSFKAR